MTAPGQFTVQMPDGVTVERLPVGRAAGRLWFTFVLSDIAPERAHGMRFHQDVLDMVGVAGADGEPLDWMSGGSGGDETAYTFSTAYRDTGQREARVTYRFKGHEQAREDLALPPVGSLGGTETALPEGGGEPP